MIALTVLTGCQTKALTDNRSYEQILMEMVPEVPELPSFPEVTWFLVDGNYAVSAADADQILDYLENQVPAYSFRMKQFKKKLIILENTLSEDV